VGAGLLAKESPTTSSEKNHLIAEMSDCSSVSTWIHSSNEFLSSSRYQTRKKNGKGGLTMSQTLTNFDMAALLDSDEAISEYLSQVLADGDNEEFLRAIGYVVKARGMTQIAKDSGMGRESLYKAFAPGAKPRFDTVLKVIHALGIDLCAQPGHTVNHSNP
jgi:probable addiction module antidote protein